MVTPAERQQILDAEHLRLLSIVYYVSGGLHAALGVFPLLYVAVGAMMLAGGPAFPRSDASPAFVGWIFILMGLVFFGFFLLIAVLQLLTGRYLRRRQHRAFCVVVAGASCILIPFGTALGVFTFIALQRPSVSGLFSQAPAAAGQLAVPEADPAGSSGSSGAT